MTVGTVRALIKRVVVGLGLLAVLVGVPAMSLTLVGWPLPTYVPDPGDVLIAIQQGNVPSTFVLKALAVGLWIVWLQFAWATVWEIAVNLRRSDRGQMPARAPLVGRGVQGSASRLVASLFVASVITAPTVGTFAPIATAAAYSSPLPTPTSPDDAELRSPVVTPQLVWHVLEGDSLWGIAETALGDGSRVGEILELNPSIASPRAVRVGVVLILPPGAVVPADRAARPETPTVEEQYLPEQTVTIVPGDTLWDLSEERLELAGDDDPAPVATVTYLRSVIAANPDVIEDPNLIFPGEVFTFPAIGEAPSTNDDAPDPIPMPARPSTPAPTTTSPLLPTTSAPAPSATATPTSGPDSAVTVTSTAPATAAEAPASDVNRPWQQRWMVTAGVSTLLAGSLLASVRRVRQRRCARSAPDPTLAALSNAEGLLSRRSGRVFTDWTTGLIADLAKHVAQTGFDGVPVAMEFDEHEIELLWDRPNPEAVAPWTAASDGWAWQATFGLDEYETTYELDAPESRALPALVTVGSRDGRQLAIDLEALGTVTIVGDTTAAADLVRSMAIELGDGEGVSNAQVVLVGFDLALDEHLKRVSTKTDAAALGLLSTLVEQHRQVIERAGVATTFQLRGMPPFGRETTVFIVNAERPSRVDEVLALVEPGLAVAVVVLSPTPMTEAVIDVKSTERATLSPLGVEFVPAAFEARASEMLADQLDVLVAGHEASDDVARLDGLIVPIAADSTESATGLGRPVDHPEVEAQQDLEPDSLTLFSEEACESVAEGATPAVDAGGKLLIRVLGVPRVEHSAQLGQRDVSLLAFVACCGGSATDDQVIDAVWSGKTMTKPGFGNRLTKIRNALNGVVHLRDKCDPTVRLDDVTTDLALMADLIEQAPDQASGDEIATLTSALAWIEGRPFDAAGFEWAYSHQFHARASELIEAATVRLVDLALESDDVASARFAVSQALKALPLNESIYRARMRAEAAADNLTAVRKAYDELALLLDDLDDGYQPSPETKRLLQELTSGQRSA